LQGKNYNETGDVKRHQQGCTSSKEDEKEEYRKYSIMLESQAR
jgi:hypothetical protein